MSVLTISYCYLGDTPLESCTNYAVEFDDQELVEEAEKKYPQIFTVVGKRIGIINFGNYIGRAKFLEKEIFVTSWKISQQDYEQMLDEVTEAITGLPFNFDTPTFEEFEYDSLGDMQVLYHLFLVVKYLVLSKENSLESYFAAIVFNPTRSEEREVVEQNIWEIAHVTPQTIIGIIANPQRLSLIHEGNKLASGKLSRSISNPQRRTVMPEKALSYKLIRTLDTPENRFIKFFIQLCIDIVEQFQKKIMGKNSINILELMDDCTLVVDKLQELLYHDFFTEINNMMMFPAQSAALQKRYGYKEVLESYIRLQHTIRISILQEKVVGIIENKDIATLYEMWTFFKMAQVITECVNLKPEKADIIGNDDLEIKLKHGITLIFLSDPVIKLSYNRSFYHGKGTYSLPLRPDIVLEIGESMFIFDAKFKLNNNLHWPKDTGDLKGAGYKMDDLCKMHTYKDAISKVKLACILYPNPDSRKIDFFEEKPGCGVGAIPLLPGTDTSHFASFILEKCLVV